MHQKTSKVGNIGWTVHTETGWHILDKRTILAKVYDPSKPDAEREFNAWYNFLNAYTQSTDVTGILWPEYTTDIEALRPARDAFMALDGETFRRWLEDIDTVNAAPGSDSDLLPAEDLPVEKKETPLSQPSETLTVPV